MRGRGGCDPGHLHQEFIGVSDGTVRPVIARGRDNWLGPRFRIRQRISRFSERNRDDSRDQGPVPCESGDMGRSLQFRGDIHIHGSGQDYRNRHHRQGARLGVWYCHDLLRGRRRDYMGPDNLVVWHTHFQQPRAHRRPDRCWWSCSLRRRHRVDRHIQDDCIHRHIAPDWICCGLLADSHGDVVSEEGGEDYGKQMVPTSSAELVCLLRDNPRGQ